MSISARQIDRRLKSRKAGLRKRIYGRTKPGTLLKHHIPIRTDNWDVKAPGWTEVDTVSHSGNCAEGTFCYTVNQTDILTTWVESRAILGKAEDSVVKALSEMARVFPFKVRGIDSDNVLTVEVKPKSGRNTPLFIKRQYRTNPSVFH